MSVLTRITREAAVRLFGPERCFTRMPRTGDSGRPSVYLTFDDGPHPERTARVLDQLAAAGARATFFVIGRRARKHPALLRRILNEGHALGSHTWRHWGARRLSTAAWMNDVRRGREEIEQITGVGTDLFRPPFGELTPGALWQLLAARFRIVLWTHDTRDFLLPSLPELRSRFLEAACHDGAVVLMHDDRCVTSYVLEHGLRDCAASVRFQAIPGTGSGLPTPRRPIRQSAADLFCPAAETTGPAVSAAGAASSWRFS